jgi:hypothetical protein
LCRQHCDKSRGPSLFPRHCSPCFSTGHCSPRFSTGANTATDRSFSLSLDRSQCCRSVGAAGVRFRLNRVRGAICVSSTETLHNSGHQTSIQNVECPSSVFNLRIWWGVTPTPPYLYSAAYCCAARLRGFLLDAIYCCRILHENISNITEIGEMVRLNVFFVSTCLP